MTDHPSGCCDECLAELPDHWLMDFVRYCEHRKVMSRRRTRADAWSIVPNVSRKTMQKHLASTMKKLEAYAKQQGLDMKDVDALLTAYRLRDPDRS